jgi:uncharacterized OB-fold protein
MRDRPADWTGGTPQIVVSTCTACGTAWYLPREHCPTCGLDRVTEAPSRGAGRCVAVTRVHLTTGGPVALALVELDEGVLVLARARDGLAPGDRARLGFTRTGGGLLPCAARSVPR